MHSYSKPVQLDVPQFDKLAVSKYWTNLKECLAFNGTGAFWLFADYDRVMVAALAMPANTADSIARRTSRLDILDNINMKMWALVSASLRSAPDIKSILDALPLVVANTTSGAHYLEALRNHLFNNPNPSTYYPIETLLRHFKQGEAQTVSEAINEINALQESLPPPQRLADTVMIGILRVGLTDKYSENVRAHQARNPLATYAAITTSLLDRSLEDEVYNSQRKKREDDSAHVVVPTPSSILVGADQAHAVRDSHARSPRNGRGRGHSFDSGNDSAGSASSRSSWSSRGSRDGSNRNSRRNYRNYSSSSHPRPSRGYRSPSPAKYVAFNGDCNYCHKPGHMAADCRRRIADEVNKNTSTNAGKDRSDRRGDDRNESRRTNHSNSDRRSSNSFSRRNK